MSLFSVLHFLYFMGLPISRDETLCMVFESDIHKYVKIFSEITHIHFYSQITYTQSTFPYWPHEDNLKKIYYMLIDFKA